MHKNNIITIITNMDKIIQYTKNNFKPSKQHTNIIDINKMVDDAQEWMLDIVFAYDYPKGGIDLDMFRKEMAEHYTENIERFYE